MCANIITRDKEGNIVRQLMPYDYFEDRKQCHAPFCNQWIWLDKALVNGYCKKEKAGAEKSGVVK